MLQCETHKVTILTPPEYTDKHTCSIDWPPKHGVCMPLEKLPVGAVFCTQGILQYWWWGAIKPQGEQGFLRYTQTVALPSFLFTAVCRSCVTRVLCQLHNSTKKTRNIFMWVCVYVCVFGWVQCKVGVCLKLQQTKKNKKKKRAYRAYQTTLQYCSWIRMMSQWQFN